MSFNKKILLGVGLSGMLASSATFAAGCANNPYCWAPQYPKGYGPNSISNATVAPKFTGAQKNAICLAEANFSIMAAYAHAVGCAATTSYTFTVRSSSPQNATYARLAKDVTQVIPVVAGVPVIDATVTANGSSSLVGLGTNLRLVSYLGDTQSPYGDKCFVVSPSTSAGPPAQTVGGSNFDVVDPTTGLAAVGVAPLTPVLLGTLRWSANGSMMTGPLGNFLLGTNMYNENIIKDFGHKSNYQNPIVDGYKEGVDVDIDWGLEVISKVPTSDQAIEIPPARLDSRGFPVSKWWQRSLHVGSNGIDGMTNMEKIELVNAAGAGSCKLAFSLQGNDEAGDYNETGTFTLGPR